MADLLDILSLDEALRAVNLRDNSVEHLDKLALFNTGIARRVDDLCGPVVRRTVTEVLDGGDSAVWLARYPVVSITSVTETAEGGSPVTVTASGYTIELASGRLHRKLNYWATGVGNVAVTYVAGRYTTTAAVDAQWKLAVQDILATTWRQMSPVWQRTQEFDDEGVPSIVTIDEMIRRRLPTRGPNIVMIPAW